MNIRTVTDNEVEAWIKDLGETFIPGSQESFDAFEQKFLTAYHTIFTEVSKVATVKEGGASGKADLAMSQWMEPTRAIGVVAMHKAALKPELLAALTHALKQMDEKFGVVLDRWPTQVCLSAEEQVLIRNESNESDLVALGLK